MTAAVTLVRWAHLLTLMSVFGATAFLTLRRREEADTVPYLFAAALIAFVTAVLQLALTTFAVAGALDLTALFAVLRHTIFGQVFLIRAVALLVLCGVLLARKPNHMIAAIASAIALIGIAATSHAAAAGNANFAAFRAVNDAVHLIAASFWLGSLAVLAYFARHLTPQALAKPVAQFSEWGLYAVAILLTAGATNAAFIFAAQRVARPYELLLIVKIVLAFGMVGYAITNRLRIMPKLEHGEGADTLNRNIRTEIVLAITVVGLAALLGNVSPA